MNINEYQNAIETLVDDGHVILQVFTENTCLYFTCYEFKESFSSTSESVEFCSVNGINITSFMRNNGGNMNIIELRHRFNAFIKDAKVVRCEFSKGINWLKWGSSSR